MCIFITSKYGQADTGPTTAQQSSILILVSSCDMYHILILRPTTQSNPEQAAFATALWERIRRSFPELRIYRIWDKPIGPHTVAMFEVNIFTPMQFGAFIPWLVINRGPLSALVHPNTGDDERDHTQRATWLGEKMALDLGTFKRMRQAMAQLKALQTEKDEKSPD